MGTLGTTPRNVKEHLGKVGDFDQVIHQEICDLFLYDC